jgi:hypothetical protein
VAIAVYAASRATGAERMPSQCQRFRGAMHP